MGWNLVGRRAEQHWVLNWTLWQVVEIDDMAASNSIVIALWWIFWPTQQNNKLNHHQQLTLVKITRDFFLIFTLKSISGLKINKKCLLEQHMQITFFLKHEPNGPNMTK